MRKQTIFTTDIYKEYNFLNDKEIEHLINSIDELQLTNHNSFIGLAKSTYGNSKSYFLNDHKDLKDRIEKELYKEGIQISNSWINVQGKDSKLNFHCHPDSIISGAIYLKVDEDSSKLVFQNPNSQYYNFGEDISITPVKGLMLMWPSQLMHGSGVSINKSIERIVISFNTFFNKETNA